MRLRRAPLAASTNVGSPAALVTTVHDRCVRSTGGSTATIVGSKNKTGKARVATVCASRFQRTGDAPVVFIDHRKEVALALPAIRATCPRMSLK